MLKSKFQNYIKIFLQKSFKDKKMSKINMRK